MQNRDETLDPAPPVAPGRTRRRLLVAGAAGVVGGAGCASERATDAAGTAADGVDRPDGDGAAERPAAAGPADDSAVPAWDARGVGPLPRQGVSAVDVAPDGSSIAVGTIAGAGDPNLLVLDGGGTVVRSERAGIRFVGDVAVDPSGTTVRAVASITEGAPVSPSKLFGMPIDGTGGSIEANFSTQGDFHYGSHSNHTGAAVAAANESVVAPTGDGLRWLGSAVGTTAATAGGLPETVVALGAASGADIAAVGGIVPAAEGGDAAAVSVYKRGTGSPVWSRPQTSLPDAEPVVDDPQYGAPRPNVGPSDSRPLSRRRTAVRAPLSVAVGVPTDGPAWRVAAAEYRGWTDRVYSNPDRQFQPELPRFARSRPAVTVHDATGTGRRFGPERFDDAFWAALAVSGDGRYLYAWPHNWHSRGLAGEPRLPADPGVRSLHVLDVHRDAVTRVPFPDVVADVTTDDRGVSISCWDGRVYRASPGTLAAGTRPEGVAVGGPARLASTPDGSRTVAATHAGTVHAIDASGAVDWRTDLSDRAPSGTPAWADEVSADAVADGIWRNVGQYRSDMGNQWVVEAPEGLLLVDANAGHSFDRQWRALENAGLDPTRVEYVILTHQHGDHAPGAYLWRQRADADVIAGRETAFRLRHTVPKGVGYGFNPPSPVDVVVEEAERTLAGLPVRLLRLPGHTHGSIGLAFESNGRHHVVTGDLVMADGVLGYAGSSSFGARNVLHSLERVASLDADALYGGHAGGIDAVDAGLSKGRRTGWGATPAPDPDPYYGLDTERYRVAGWNAGAASADFGDLDGDGRPDAVTLVGPNAIGNTEILDADPGERRPELHLYRNDAGAFDEREPTAVVGLPELDTATEVLVTDVGPADAADLLVVGADRLLLLAATGDRFRYERHELADRNLGAINQVSTADFDRDGRSEALVGRGFGGYTLLSRTGDGYSLSHPDWRSAPYGRAFVRDVTGDGRGDLITSGGDVYLAPDDGPFGTDPDVDLPEPGGWTHGTVGDFTGDGRTDVALVGRQSETGLVYHNTGDPDRPFEADDRTTFGIDAHPVRSGPVAADWTGGGADDLLIPHRGHDLTVVYGGDGGPPADRVETVSLDHFVHHENVVSVADFGGESPPALATYGNTSLGGGASEPSGVFVWHPGRS